MIHALAILLLAVQNPPEKYTNTKYGYELTLPKDWSSAATPTSQVVELREPSPDGDRVRAEFILSNVIGDSPTAPAGMKEGVKKYMDKAHAGYEQLWESDAPVGGEPAYAFAARLKRTKGGELIVVRAMVSRTLIDKFYISAVFDGSVGAEATRKTVDGVLQSMKFVPRGVGPEDQKAIDRLATRVKSLTDAQHRMAVDEWYTLHVGTQKTGHNRVGWYHLKSEGAMINGKPGIKYTSKVQLTDPKGNATTITGEGSFTLDLGAQTETVAEEVKDDKAVVRRSHTLKGRIDGAKASLDWTVGEYKSTKEAAVPGLTMLAGTSELVRRALVPGPKDLYGARVLLVSEDAWRLESYEAHDMDRGQINDQMMDFQQLSIRRDIGVIEAFFDKSGSMMSQMMHGGAFLMKRSTEAEATQP